MIVAARKDLNTYAREQVQPSPTTPTFKDSMQSMRAALDTMSEQSKTYNVGMQDAGSRALAEQTAIQNSPSTQ